MASCGRWKEGSPSFLVAALCTSRSEKEARSRRFAKLDHYSPGGALVSKMLLLACGLVV